MIRVFIITDVRLFREGLTQLLGNVEGLQVVGAATGLDEALARVRETRPNVVLIDLGLPGSIGIVHAIRGVGPDHQVVAIALPEAEVELVACIEAGVAGYVTREAGVRELVDAILSVARGEFLCSARVAGLLRKRVADLAKHLPHAASDPHLTGREQEVVSLLDQGLANKDIARRLGIEVATVKNHVHSILYKLHVHRRGEAAARMRFEIPNALARGRRLGVAGGTG